MLSVYDLNQDVGSGTVIWIELKEGTVIDSVKELIGRIEKITDDRIFGVIVGPADIKSQFDELFSYGVDTLYHFRSDIEYQPDEYADMIIDVADRVVPMSIILSGTAVGNNVAEKVSFKLGKPLLRDCTGLDYRNDLLTVEGAKTDFIPMFTKHGRFPMVVTVRPGSFGKLMSEKRNGTVIIRQYQH